jgi:uncharacterized phiE125 gp8 family phage protein
VSLSLITPPTVEPVSLAEAKLHLRVDFDDDDALIESLISAARVAAETLTGRQICTARWMRTLDGFPYSSLHLHRCPVQSVVEISYQDQLGQWQTLDPSIYVSDLTSEPARITPRFGNTWPITLSQIGVVRVVFDAGYGTPSDVPEGLKSWIKLRIGSLYAHREEMSILSKGRIDPLPFVDGLLDPYRVALV